MRYVVLAIVFSVLSAFVCAAQEGPKVDFGYAFSTPHRMTVARPDSSDKTLLDLEPGYLRVAWTYENLLNIPLAAYVTPQAVWAVKMTPLLDGKPFAQSAWTRGEKYLPVLENTYTDPTATVQFEVTGGESAAVIKVTMKNTGTADAKVSVSCECQRGFFGYNPAYADPDQDRDCLLAGWGDRADRVIVLGVGADEYTIGGATTLCPAWNVPAGQERTGWIVRPYRGYSADLPSLRSRDWQNEVNAAKDEWRALLGRAVRISVPDAGVQNAFYACLGDLFIMREPVAGGYVAATPGTDCYRATNPGEAAIVAVSLDQVGLNDKAAQGYQMCLDQQGDDGNWADPKGWCHLMWCVSGFKSWAAMEHYRLTGDRSYLEMVYPKMLASSRWQERQRARTRVMKDGERPLTYGLMPRGMGDCGLKDGDDLYGVYLPHNIWATYADRCAMEAAEILGRKEDAVELKKIFEAAREDLVQALDKGAIAEDDYRWIPGVPGKTSGSRWGALNALFPCELLPADHELIVGTVRCLRSKMSPGGLPLNTGWLPNGMWVAIALDNLAEAHLVRNEADEAADLLYATLNHATPLYTWCEERGQEPGAKEVTGDRQHLWTPVSVTRFVRDCLVMEDGKALHLGRGAHGAWLGGGKAVGIVDAPTHFGRISYEMKYDTAAGQVSGRVSLMRKEGENLLSPDAVVLHVRLPKGLKIASVDAGSKASVAADGSGLQWEAFTGEQTFQAVVAR